MNPLRSTALVLGTVTLVATGYYFVQQRSTHTISTSRSTTSVATASTATAHDHGIGSARRPSFHMPPGQGKIAAADKKASGHSSSRSSTRLQCPDNIPTQCFHLKAERDTVIKTAGGCTVQVPANAFVDANGTHVKGAVSVDVKEVLKPIDYVLGNMMTVYNGKALESGGTFAITASANGRELFLADNAALNMAVPSRMKKSGMKFFPGEEKADGVIWKAPEELKAPQPLPVVEQKAELNGQGKLKRTNVTYWVEGFQDPMDAPIQVHDEVARIAWLGDGLWLKRDSDFTVGKYEVHFIANPREMSTNAGWPLLGQWSTSGVREDGINSFQEDPETHYIFNVKRLGWANIDRLMCDKRTKPVDIVTAVANDKGMKDVCITLVMKSHGLYIPGYRKADGSYGFSHGDFEQMQLPVGAKATVLCTAQKDGKPWYALQEITITEKGRVELTLEPTVTQDLRKELMAAL